MHSVQKLGPQTKQYHDTAAVPAEPAKKSNYADMGGLTGADKKDKKESKKKSTSSDQDGAFPVMKKGQKAAIEYKDEDRKQTQYNDLPPSGGGGGGAYSQIPPGGGGGKYDNIPLSQFIPSGQAALALASSLKDKS